MRYYISDLHFFHANMNTNMDKRGFSSVEEMNQCMIKKWNHKVRKKDEVVILGDFSIGTAEETNDILKQLNGIKYLIIGNHDRYLKSKDFDKTLFKWIKPYATLKDNKRKIVLCHYPIMCYYGQYRLDENGNPKSYMLYGHVNNSYDEYLINKYQNETRKTQRRIYREEDSFNIPSHMINCFCMFSDYEPLTLDEWILLDELRRKNIREEDFEK